MRLTRECEPDTMMKNDPSPWRILQSTYLYREPWLTMRRDSVRLPNGRDIDSFYVWEYPPWVNIIAITEQEQQIVLIRQYRHGLGSVHYELPAGVHDHQEETLLEAAQRELLEETGYSGGLWSSWMQLSANPALQNNISHTFLAEGVIRKNMQQLDETEEITVHTLPPKDVLSIIEQGEMLQALHTAPLLKYLLNCID
jgi:8-oxo-dGTP pyrophosphatase MutT (NUDIX family)